LLAFVDLGQCFNFDNQRRLAQEGKMCAFSAYSTADCDCIGDKFSIFASLLAQTPQAGVSSLWRINDDLCR